LAETLRSAPFWLITFVQFISASTIYTLIQWIPSYLTTIRQLRFQSMSGWITLGYVLATVLTLTAGYLADRTMQRAITGAIVSLSFAVLVIPAQLLPDTGSALLLSTLIGVASTTAALNGTLMHTLIRSDAIARATGVYAGIGNCSSAIGPFAFGVLISSLGGQYWGGFLMLAVMNVIGAGTYLVLHGMMKRSDRLGATHLDRQKSAAGVEV
jgi:MFS family permease